MAVKTAEGDVTVRPAAAGVETIDVRAIVETRSSSSSRARFDADLVELSTPVSGVNDTTQEITWSWRTPRSRDRQAAVSFEITMPPDLALSVETSSGNIDVVGVAGDCHLRTEHGSIRAVASVRQLTAQTLRGSLIVESPALHVDLRVEAGSLKAYLTNPERIGGRVSCGEGNIDLGVLRSVNTSLRAKALRGRIEQHLDLLSFKHRSSSVVGAGSISGGGDLTSVTAPLGTGGDLLDVFVEQGDILLHPIVDSGSTTSSGL